MGIGIHAVTSARVEVLDVAQAEGPAAVLVALELGDRRLGGVRAVETDNAAALGPAADGLILNLGLLDLADGGEEFNQIVVARGPGKLRITSQPTAKLGDGQKLSATRRHHLRCGQRWCRTSQHPRWHGR
jgi:hypothetical protein